MAQREREHPLSVHMALATGVFWRFTCLEVDYLSERIVFIGGERCWPARLRSVLTTFSGYKLSHVVLELWLVM